ncbi:MAG TPA: chemotaxis protein CheW [Desulfobacterales bacterium]|nr:chemotaxis protein CheW [Desulfobacterales bacterium]
MKSRQFVTFGIDDYLLGIDILKVREINRVLDITPVQHARTYVRGLINLRGQTVTVFDLGRRLGLALRKIAEESHNIILKNDAVGLLVDSIRDVVVAQDDEIEQPPANVGGIEGKFIEGIVKLEKDLLVILSAEKILEYKAVKSE